MSNNLKRRNGTIISKIRSIFSKEEEKEIINNKKNKEEFKKSIVVIEDEEEKRIKEIKKLYDNRKIKEDKLSNKDIEKLIEMYNKEIQELRADTKRRLFISDGKVKK